MESSRLLYLEIRLFSMKVSYYNPPLYILIFAVYGFFLEEFAPAVTQTGLEPKALGSNYFGVVGFKHWLLTRDN